MATPQRPAGRPAIETLRTLIAQAQQGMGGQPIPGAVPPTPQPPPVSEAPVPTLHTLIELEEASSLLELQERQRRIRERLASQTAEDIRAALDGILRQFGDLRFRLGNIRPAFRTVSDLVFAASDALKVQTAAQAKATAASEIASEIVNRVALATIPQEVANGLFARATDLSGTLADLMGQAFRTAAGFLAQARGAA